MNDESEDLTRLLDFYKNFEELETKSHFIRGYIISEVILLERLIDEYISRYLTTDIEKIKFIREVVLGSEKIVFDNKRQILHQILKVNNIKFLKDNPNFINDLSYLMEKRNNVAHLLMDVTKGKVEKKDSISLQKHRNVTTEVVLDEQEIEKIRKLIKESREIMVELIRIDFNHDHYKIFRKFL